ncbi:hypothetical protein SBOR_7906 [Sclerotinia borealis F-4128]|uniref:Uncharacterized protein n=1 Tax=Sclerotinia borealis (strain F-4128) TaxID=1432307 RepID=W9C775_SCLBF|nr:hypothetical protein SBOR_7906 [Sclerotinia borealis F-4128]
MEVAIQRSELGSVNNLFLVSEPEAAAAYVLANSPTIDWIKPGETFILLDAGGGTVDVTTYMVNNVDPLKLKREEMAAREGERSDIETNGRTIEGIVDQQTIKFENVLKRTIDVTNELMPCTAIHIDGIRESQEKGFTNNRVVIKRTFERCLEGIRGLMLDQITLAQEAGLDVKSFTPTRIGKRLRKLRKQSGIYIELEILANPSSLETAMASGAILRAFVEEDDELERISLCSYRFRLQDEFNPKAIPAHKNVKPKYDSNDGVAYVDVIEWVVKMGEIIPAAKEYRIPAYRIFAATRKTFIYEQELYISDNSTESDYKLTHPKNKGLNFKTLFEARLTQSTGAERTGTIKLDMGELIRSGTIQPTEEEEGIKGKRHYRIDFELVMKVKGRNLEIEGYVAGKLLGSTEISIAAAFVPRTK